MKPFTSVLMTLSFLCCGVEIAAWMVGSEQGKGAFGGAMACALAASVTNELEGDEK